MVLVVTVLTWNPHSRVAIECLQCDQCNQVTNFQLHFISFKFKSHTGRQLPYWEVQSLSPHPTPQQVCGSEVGSQGSSSILQPHPEVYTHTWVHVFSNFHVFSEAAVDIQGPCVAYMLSGAGGDQIESSRGGGVQLCNIRRPWRVGGKKSWPGLGVTALVRLERSRLSVKEASQWIHMDERDQPLPGPYEQCSHLPLMQDFVWGQR